MTAVVGTPWRNENARRKYPFADRASLVASNGDLLDPGLFLDARITVDDVTDAPVRLVSVRRDNTGLAFVLETGNGTGLAAAYLPGSPQQTGDAGLCMVFPASGPATQQAVGTIVVSAAAAEGFGRDLEFEGESAVLCASAHTLVPVDGVRRLTVPGIAKVSGAIVLVAGVGVIHDEDAAGRMHVVGEPNTEVCLGSESRVYLPCFRSLAGLLPDVFGNIGFVVATEDSLLKIEPVDGGLKLSLGGQDARA